MNLTSRRTAGESVVVTLPGGEKILFGGTRRGVKLSRPVEAGEFFDPILGPKCPFHNPDEASLAEFYGGTIRLMGNKFTPHRNHRLVIPRDCTDEEFVRTLGGTNILSRCLNVVAETTSSNPDEEQLFAANVLRGQNLPHLHWHVYSYWEEEGLDVARERAWTVFEKDAELVLHTNTIFQVVVRGPLVGQIMIIPVNGPIQMKGDVSHELARVLHLIVTACNRAFQSAQGKPPQYSVSGRTSGENLLYVLYTPTLQSIGCSDDLADLNGTARARPWSPHETAAHLKKFF
jgi:hypothetical protein